MNPLNIQEGDRINYNDGRSGHDVNAVVLEADDFSMTVQFDDREDVTFISFGDAEWMKFIRKL